MLGVLRRNGQHGGRYEPTIRRRSSVERERERERERVREFASLLLTSTDRTVWPIFVVNSSDILVLKIILVLALVSFFSYHFILISFSYR